MRVIDLIDKLSDSGDLMPLICCGLISPNIPMYRKVWSSYHFHIEKDVSRMQAIENVCFTFQISQSYVYKILSFMRQEVA